MKQKASQPKQITYYAIARNAQGRVGQLLVTRENGRQVSQVWTGVEYRNERKAYADLARLNGCS